MKKRPKNDRRSPEVVEAGRNAAAWMMGLQVLVIVLAVVCIYWPVLEGGWLWDDSRYVTSNLLLRSFTGLEKIWFEPKSFVEYYPILATAEWVQWHLWGMETLGYHVTNLGLHCINALLVWRVLGKFGLRLAWLGGLIFAIHPVQVESVAWISELKNTLSLPPFLLAVCAWIDYEEKKLSRDYWIALGLFLVAMLCKISMVSFPLMILFYAWWKRDRITLGDLQASAPFFVISLVLGALTVYLGAVFTHSHSVHDMVGVSLGSVTQGGWASRVAVMGLSLSFYFFNCIWPVGLLPIYPKWAVNPPSPWQFLPWPVMAVLFYGLWTGRKNWGKGVLLGAGFFLLMLLPFAALHWSFTWVMDHFLYIPIIGLIGLVVAGLGQIDERWPWFSRPYGIGILAAVMALMAYDSFSYAGVFIDSETLWTFTLSRNPDSWLAHNNLGNAFIKKGEIDGAIAEFEKALQVNANYAKSHNNLGYSLLQKGRVDDAIEEYEKAVKIDPDFADAYGNIGVALAQKGQIDEAIVEYQKALSVNPSFVEVMSNLGLALAKKNRWDEAIVQWQKAVEINPDYAQGHTNLGVAFMQKGLVNEATAQFQEAVRLDPTDPNAQSNLAKAEAMAPPSTGVK